MSASQVGGVREQKAQRYDLHINMEPFFRWEIKAARGG